MADDGDPRGLPRLSGEELSISELQVIFDSIEERLDQIHSVRGWFKTRLVKQGTEPVPNNNEVIMWHDDLNTKYFLIADFNGTVKKVELT